MNNLLQLNIKFCSRDRLLKDSWIIIFKAYNIVELHLDLQHCPVDLPTSLNLHCGLAGT